MMTNIDFSIFSSPIKAYGSVSGEIDVPEPVSEGNEVFILQTGKGDWFSGKLKIVFMTRLQGDSEKTVIGLEDVVAPSSEAARDLITRLENEAGLFFDKYD